MTIQKPQVSLEDIENEEAKEMLSMIRGIINKETQEIEMESFSDYPKSVKNNAKRGIELNKKINNKCATEVGKIRAQQLAQGKPYETTCANQERHFFRKKSACGSASHTHRA